MSTPTPILAHAGNAVEIRFDVYPPASSHAAVHFYSAEHGKQFFDCVQGLLPAGASGKAITIKEGRKQAKSKNLRVTVKDGVSYSATVCFRGADDFAFGPESARSNSIIRALPVAPGAPRLKAYLSLIHI